MKAASTPGVRDVLIPGGPSTKWKNTLASKSTVTTALQEANETEAVTRQEAAKGDQVAIRKLAQQQAQQELQALHAPKSVASKKNSSLDIVEIKGVNASQNASDRARAATLGLDSQG